MTGYQLSDADRWGLLHPRMGEAALMDWDVRMPADARSPEFAWLYSTPVRGVEAVQEARVYHGLTASDEYYAAVFPATGIRETVDGPEIVSIQRADGAVDALERELWGLAPDAGGIVDEADAPDPFVGGVPAGHLPRTHIVDDRIADLFQEGMA